jgi:hypothetical protein
VDEGGDSREMVAQVLVDAEGWYVSPLASLSGWTTGFLELSTKAEGFGERPASFSSMPWQADVGESSQVLEFPPDPGAGNEVGPSCNRRLRGEYSSWAK